MRAIPGHVPRRNERVTQDMEPKTRGHGRLLVAMLAVLALLATGCGSDGDGGDSAATDDADSSSTTAARSNEPFVISAIPDQDPEKLQRLYGTLASYLGERLGVTVRYEPVTDYTASVSLFLSGDLDMVWFGGLTGVQARLQADGAKAILQRDIDEAFHSVFIANTASGLQPFDDVKGLAALKGRRFTFGSESSTSGRLMPEHFLGQAGVATTDFDGQVGFSGSHDKTIALVEAGTFEAGVVNEQVWKSSVEGGKVDTTKVTELFRTPAYHDYHWVIGPEVAERYGDDFLAKVTDAFLALDPADPKGKEILDLFGAKAFIETDNGNYGQIEEVGRRIGLIT